MTFNVIQEIYAYYHPLHALNASRMFIANQEIKLNVVEFLLIIFIKKAPIIFVLDVIMIVNARTLDFQDVIT